MERQREIDGDTQRERETETEGERHTERQMKRQRERQRDRDIWSYCLLLFVLLSPIMLCMAVESPSA